MVKTDAVDHLLRNLSPDRDIRSDAELLKSLRLDRSAMESIVRRHGSRVLAACRKILGDCEEVDDAFQATFLVLLNRPSAIRRDASLGAWLFGVAHRIALQARKRREKSLTPPDDSTAPDVDLSWREACAILHKELDTLPDSLRLPLMLCYLEGQSRDQAASELGRSLNSVKKSLERGRELLRNRLSSRGINLSAGLLAMVAEATSCELPSGLADSTAPRLLHPTPPIQQLAAPFVGPSLFRPIVASAIAFAAIVLVAVSMTTDPPIPQSSAKEPKNKPEERAKAPIDENRIAFSGQVVDPQGKPVKGAKVHLAGRTMFLYYDSPGTEQRAITDSDGRFQFTLDLSNSEIRFGFGQLLTAHSEKHGSAISWISENGNRDLKLKLVEDQPIRGRLRDTKGKPVADALVRVVTISAAENDDPTIGIRHMEEYGTNTGIAGETQHFHREMRSEREPVPGFETPVRTDAEGRFEILGVGKDRLVKLRFEGEQIAMQEVRIFNRPGVVVSYPLSPYRPRFNPARADVVHPSNSEYTVSPTQVIEGTVTDKATGKPMSGAVVGAMPPGHMIVSDRWWHLRVRATTDENGRYRLVGCPPGQHRVTVFAPADQPYLRFSALAGKEKNLDPVRMDFALHQAVWVSGSVKDIRTDRPIPAARIVYMVDEENKKNAEFTGVEPARELRYTYSKADGQFRVLTMPGRGWLRVEHEEHFVPASQREGQGNFQMKKPEKPGPADGYAMAGINVDPAKPKEYHLTLDSGERFSIPLLDPDGKPLKGVMALERKARKSRWLEPLANSEINIALTNPERPEAIVLYHPERRLGLYFSHDDGRLPPPREVGKAATPEREARLPAKLTLQPLGNIKGRLLLPSGKPNSNALLRLNYPGTPAPPPPNMKIEVRTDKEGRFQFDNLIAPWQYHVQFPLDPDSTFFNGVEMVRLKPGETHDLGDLQRPK